MKQLLLRVDDEVHARLRERAQREHRSVNALLGDIVALAATVGPDSAQDRLRARAAALGMLATRTPRAAELTENSPVHVDMDEIARLTSGWGPQLDAIIAEDRERS